MQSCVELCEGFVKYLRKLCQVLIDVCEDVVKLVVNGVEFTNFISFELKNTMISITTDFSFTYAPKIKYVNLKRVRSYNTILNTFSIKKHNVLK